MSWIDNFLQSGLFIWILLGLFGLHLYLKKSGKTLPEFLRGISEFFQDIGETSSHGK